MTMEHPLLTRSQIIAHCMTYPDAVETYPFHDFNWTVMQHTGNGKMFAAIFERNGIIWVNVKAEPDWAVIWCGTYESVQPAYHMNKRHWVSILLDGKMANEDIVRLIDDSYHLTLQKNHSKQHLL